MAGASGGNGGAAGDSGGCPLLAGPAMVAVPGGYCIDSTEVTRGQYAAWLASSPSLTGQPDCCDFNQSFEPDPTCAQDARIYQGPNSDKHPQTCVNWCDAGAYCLGVGKRLCGRIGGGMVEGQYTRDPAQDQWYAACSSGGLNKYPYGNTYDPMVCDGHDSGNLTSVEVGSMPGCQSGAPGYQGVFDLSGNAWEWEDSCIVICNSSCMVRGGASGEEGPDRMSCEYYGISLQRSRAVYSVGFRCCWP